MPTDATMSAMTRVATLMPVAPSRRLIGIASHKVAATSPVESNDAGFPHGRAGVSRLAAPLPELLKNSRR